MTPQINGWNGRVRSGDNIFLTCHQQSQLAPHPLYAARGNRKCGSLSHSSKQSIIVLCLGKWFSKRESISNVSFVTPECSTTWDSFQKQHSVIAKIIFHQIMKQTMNSLSNVTGCHILLFFSQVNTFSVSKTTTFVKEYPFVCRKRRCARTFGISKVNFTNKNTNNSSNRDVNAK